MNTKLTLTVEQSIIQKAKQYARKKDRSLSDLVESYLKALVSGEPETPDMITPSVKLMKGSFKISKDFDYKEELANQLSKKYL